MVVLFVIALDSFKYHKIIKGNTLFEIYDYLFDYIACNENIVKIKIIK